MDHNKLFHILVIGGSSLTIGAGCSSEPGGVASPQTSDAANDAIGDATNEASNGADVAADSSTPRGDAGASDATSTDDAAHGDASACDPRCTWDGGLAFCDGVCCMWSSTHECCPEFTKEDAGK